MEAHRLGRIVIEKVTEFDSLDMPASTVFPRLVREDLAALRRWFTDPRLTEEPETSRIGLSMHSFIVRTPGFNVLVDACNGNHKSREAIGPIHMLDRPDYLRNLAALGLTPEHIDLVLCTHLHFDHVGWNTRLENGRWVPTFPNARYLFSRRDFVHFEGVQDTDPVHGVAFRDSVLPVLEAGKAELVEQDFEMELGSGAHLRLEPALGHSAGSVFVHVHSAAHEAVFPGDVVHHPVQLAQPDLFMPFADEDAALATSTRKRFLEAYADTDALICPAHFIEPTVGRLQRDGTRFRMRF